MICLQSSEAHEYTFSTMQVRLLSLLQAPDTRDPSILESHPKDPDIAGEIKFPAVVEFEIATSRLKVRCSTTELSCPRRNVM